MKDFMILKKIPLFWNSQVLEGSIHRSMDHSVKEFHEFNWLSLKDKRQFFSPQPASKTTSGHLLPLPMPPPSAMTLGPSEVEQPVSMTWPESKASQQGLWRPPECLVGDLQTKGSIDPPLLPWPGLTHNGRTFPGCHPSRPLPQPETSSNAAEFSLRAGFPAAHKGPSRELGRRENRKAAIFTLSYPPVILTSLPLLMLFPCLAYPSLSVSPSRASLSSTSSRKICLVILTLTDFLSPKPCCMP